MLTAPLQHQTVSGHLPSVMMRDHTAVTTLTCTTEAPDLVEWEMSAVQVGSLIAALAMIFGVVSLFS